MRPRPSRRLPAVAAVLLAALAQAPAAAPAEPDPSLSVDDYVLNGVPDLDDRWTAQDVAQVVRALRQIAEDDPARLPRLSSERSRPILVRILAGEPLGPIRDKTRPVEPRASEAAGYVTALRGLVLLYSGPEMDASFAAERVELLGLVLEASAFAQVLFDAFLEGRPDDPLLETRREAIMELRIAIDDAAGAGVSWLDDRTNHRPRHRQRLAQHLGAWLPLLVRHMPEPRQLELRSRLRATALAEADPHVRAALDHVILSVDAAVG